MSVLNLSAENRFRCLVAVLTACYLPATAFADEVDSVSPVRYSAGIQAGRFISPGIGTNFIQARFSTLRPYTLFRKKPAHEKLKMLFESTIGKAWGEYDGVIVSVGMLAHRYLSDPRAGHVRPYVEAGIGLIYTEFRVDGQGLNFNFNPQAGAGLEYLDGGNRRYFSSLRLHHVSNGGLDGDNKGINSVILLFGRDF